MDFEIKDADFKYSSIQMCRICESLAADSLICFYNFEMLYILNNLRQIVDVKDEPENDLPKYICKLCLCNLDFTVAFMKQCQTTEIKLKQSMKQRNTIETLDVKLTGFKEEEEDDDFTFTLIDEIEPQETLPPKTVTKKPKIIKCPDCKQFFDNLQQSLLHVASNCQELFKCDKCELFFKSEKRVKAHQKCKHKPAEHKCVVCDKIFKCEQNLIKHVKEVHDKVHNYFCDVCGKGFFSISPLRIHKISHKPDGERVYPKKKKKYIKNIKNDFKHMICEYCGKDFDRVSKYMQHLATHSVTSKGVYSKTACQYCGITTSTTRLEEHIRIHTGEKPFDCKECDMKFRTLPQLRIHESAVHLGEKKYECTICGKKLGYKFSYDAHMNRHTGNTKYNCNLCPMKFYEPRPLRRHQLKVHDLDTSEPKKEPIRIDVNKD